MEVPHKEKSKKHAMFFRRKKGDFPADSPGTKEMGSQ
jgi:hypothetical protein